MRIASSLLLSVMPTILSIGQERVLLCTGAAELFEVDLASCQADLIGVTSTIFKDIAFTPDGGLWGCQDGQLYSIDSQNASTSLIGTTPGFDSPALVAYNNDTLLGVYQQWLWGIRVNDGFAWPIADIGFNAAGDLTWYEGKLLLTAADGWLVSMNLSSDLSSVSNVQVVGSLNGGVGDWFGANTVMFDPCTGVRSVLGFEQGSIYFVSVLDASVTIACSGIVPSAAWGATSLGEVSVTQPVPIEWPNVFTPNRNGINDQFAPLMTLNESGWSLRVFNRWGQKVHESRSISLGWDGRDSGGADCSEGVYFYVASITDGCGRVATTNGCVTLLR